MAKAKFHKSQRVFVKPVGTWAYVEAVISFSRSSSNGLNRNRKV